MIWTRPTYTWHLIWFLSVLPAHSPRSNMQKNATSMHRQFDRTGHTQRLPFANWCCVPVGSLARTFFLSNTFYCALFTMLYCFFFLLLLSLLYILINCNLNYVIARLMVSVFTKQFSNSTIGREEIDQILCGKVRHSDIIW